MEAVQPRTALTGQSAGAHGLKVRIRQGNNFARGALVDGFLMPADVKALYEKWDAAAWGEPETFQGGADPAISCEMVMGVPEAQLEKVYGKARAQRLREAAEPNAVV